MLKKDPYSYDLLQRKRHKVSFFVFTKQVAPGFQGQVGVMVSTCPVHVWKWIYCLLLSHVFVLSMWKDLHPYLDGSEGRVSAL